MKSKTKINKEMRKKTNPELAESIYLAKKKNLIELAGMLSYPRRKQISANLEDINKIKKENIIIPGKVLSLGKIDKEKSKNLKIYALSFSKKAEKKLKDAGVEFATILHALKKNKDLKGEIIGRN